MLNVGRGSELTSNLRPATLGLVKVALPYVTLKCVAFTVAPELKSVRGIMMGLGVPEKQHHT